MASLAIFRSVIAYLLIFSVIADAFPTDTRYANLEAHDDALLEEILEDILERLPSESTIDNHTTVETRDDITQSLYYGDDALQNYYDSTSSPDFNVVLPSSAANNTQALNRRCCEWDKESFSWKCDDKLPTMNDIIRYMRKEAGGNADPGKIVAFYVNLRDVDPALRKGGDNDEAMLVAWCEKSGLRGKYYWWANACSHYWIEAQCNYLDANREKIEKENGPEWTDPKKVFLRGLMQGMAFSATNQIAFLFTPAGKDWPKDSVWQEVEFPTLARNKNVKKIYRIDPTCPDNKAELMWSRERRDPLPPVVFKYPGVL